MTRKLCYTGLFSALIAVGAFLQIPAVPVPFTLQTFFAVLAGALLGAGWGTAAVGVYLVLGLCGVPIFTKGGGFMYVAQPTFGYLLGLLPLTLLVGFLIGYLERKNRVNPFFIGCAMFFSSVIELACGLFYFAAISGTLSWELVVSMLLLFLPAELLKCVASAALYLAVRRYFPRKSALM